MTLEEQIYKLIKENNGELNLVDIACKFPYLTPHIPMLAVSTLEEEGKVIRKAVYGSRYAYFVVE